MDDMSVRRETNVRIFEDHPNYRFNWGRVCDSDAKMHEFSRRRDLTVEHDPESVGDIMNFDIDSSKVRTELSVSVQQDFSGTLRASLDDIPGCLAIK